MDSHESGHAPTPAVNQHSLLGMPAEIQQQIVSHCGQPDLICFALVSKHCRDLAASELYRQFHIVFPDEDDPAFDSPIDGLAGGLDTFVTSDYDYAKYLRDISLDSLSAGLKGEAAYKDYLFNNSCGKFMNTLLLLTLRKAKGLESFKWNIRVELSRPVYAALHNIKTITNLHIRMQAGPSLYEKPPPLPFWPVQPPPISAPSQPPVHWMPQGTHPPPAPPQQGLDFGPVSQITTTNPTFMNGHSIYLVQSQPLHHPNAFAQQPPHPQTFPSQAPFHAPSAPKGPSKLKPLKRPRTLAEPPTFSGFKNLKSLAILDMDTLDFVTEIKTCVRNSVGTLEELKLSFSDFLASKARKPPAPEVVADDSDSESVWSDPGLIPPAQASNAVTGNAVESSGAKANRAQEEKKAQESVLGRIFDVEHYVVKKPQKKVKPKGKTPAEASSSDPGQDFIKNVMKAAEVLMKEKDDMRRDALDIIESAASAYLASLKTKENGTTSASSESQPAETKVETEGELNTVGSESTAAGPSVPTRQRKEGEDLGPEDITIEEPDGELELEPGTPAPNVNEEGAVPDTISQCLSSLAIGNLEPASVEKAVANLVAQKVNYQTLVKKLMAFEARADELRKETEQLREQDGLVARERIEKEIAELSNGIEKARNEIHVVEAEVADSQKEIYGLRDSERQRRIEYVRATRGIALKGLSIYLIPVKASVLSKAIDIQMLTSITLLNVGPQAPIWAYFKSQNEEKPLPLCKIFTDNVTNSFLQLVSQLKLVTELFLLERETKYKPESFAPKTTATIVHIRRALKKHVPHLRNLMIKNMATTAWDLDAKTILLLCERGKNIEELACSMDMARLHILNVNARLLTNLCALHVISLRPDDPCPSLIVEARKFLIDTLCQYPLKNLQYVAVNDSESPTVHHLRFREPPSTEERERRKAVKKAKKGKAKATNSNINDGTSSNNNAVHYPSFPPPATWGGESSSDDSYDNDDDDGESGWVSSNFFAKGWDYAPSKSTYFEKLGPCRAYDVYGVRIFEKEVMSGRI
ncbi:hypothetical protein B0T20DRAFT_392998 [Sordaria brevicollis]|uniref:F-box domain-containing protein n=1 Tax=Sordaria brevicollis TaxID=83679 RepID=A0AAE0UC31_SORBR|nr:hypothetical protein B0T20DRAFT_392998 [Sordaria brevicollis]